MSKRKPKLVTFVGDDGIRQPLVAKADIRNWHEGAAQLGEGLKKLEYCFKEMDKHYNKQTLALITPELTYAEVWGALRCGLEELRELRAELEEKLYVGDLTADQVAGLG